MVDLPMVVRQGWPCVRTTWLTGRVSTAVDTINGTTAAPRFMQATMSAS